MATPKKERKHRHSHRHSHHEVMDEGDYIDDDLIIVDHLSGSRKVDLYLCQSEELKGLVAVKVLRPEYRLDFSALEAVLEEGERLCRLRHPNVIEGYAVELLPHPRVVMQYLRGQTVSNTFFQGNWEAFDIEDFVDVADQIADGLTYIHEEGIVHLDVKPSNVMYYDGHATLFDFSIAEEFSPDETLRDNAGTVEYMAPEQTFRREIGYSTDVIGVGVVLYQLLTNKKLPYPVVKGSLPGYDEDDVRRHLDYSADPVPPSEINPAVPPSVDEVTLRALQPDMQDRYQTPAEFQDALWEVG